MLSDWYAQSMVGYDEQSWIQMKKGDLAETTILSLIYDSGCTAEKVVPDDVPELLVLDEVQPGPQTARGQHT